MNKFFSISSVKKLLLDESIRSTFLVYLGIFAGSVINYFFQIFIARSVSVSDFGDFTALLSLSSILLVPANALMAGAIKEFTQISSTHGDRKSSRFYIELTILTLIFGFIFSGFVLLFTNTVVDRLKIAHPSYVLGFCFMMLFSYIVLVPNSALQSYLRFGKYSLLSTLSAVFRLAIPAFFLYTGLGVPGVFIGMGLGLILTYISGSVFTKRIFLNGVDMNNSGVYGSFIRTSLSALFLNLGMTLMNNMDILFVKSKFSQVDAGVFAGLVTVGKVFLFGAGSLALVMYPQISQLYAKKEDISKKLRLFVGIQVAMIVSGLLLFTLFPDRIVRLMFGEAFLPSVTYLPLFSLFVAVYILCNFFAYVLLAVSLNKMFIIQILAGVFQITLLYFSNSIESVIKADLFSSLFLLLGLLLYYKIYARFNHSSRI